MTTPIPVTTPSTANDGKPVLTKNQLNKLNSKIMKARLMNSSNLKELEEEYERELKRFEEAKTKSETKVIRYYILLLNNLNKYIYIYIYLNNDILIYI